MSGVMLAMWSPDGRRLAFVTVEGISTVNADGSGTRRVAPKGGDGPAWSPDGRRVAFLSPADGYALQVYVMNSDGGGLRRLTRTGTP